MDEDTSKHMIHVLRMQKGEFVLLTDGKGKKATAVIVDDNRKKAVVEILEITTEDAMLPKVAIAISLTKNSSRFEWFLEKATEIGINEIIPLVCERTAKDKVRLDRMRQILISAMLQSQQCWLPVLHEPAKFEKVLEFSFDQKLIAHCEDGEKRQLHDVVKKDESKLILIGPEGDFTPTEIENAIRNHFLPVALGRTRLRTETAGMYAAVGLR